MQNCIVEFITVTYVWFENLKPKTRGFCQHAVSDCWWQKTRKDEESHPHDKAERRMCVWLARQHHRRTVFISSASECLFLNYL